jgi:hypothetical protein
MKHWIFHPLIFYPLVILLAVGVVTISLRPQSWPREPAPVAAQVADGVLTLQGDAFNAPSPSPEQRLTVVRDFWGRPQNMRIAVLGRQPPPTPAEQGVRILLAQDDAALISDKPVTIEVTYNSLQVNGAWGLATSLQGIGPAEWVIQPTPPDANVVRFDLPAQVAVNAIGLRAIQNGQDDAFGLEITRIRVIPRA